MVNGSTQVSVENSSASRDRGPDVDFSAWTGQRPARQSLGSQRRPERRGVTASMSLMRVATARRRPAASERAAVLRELLKERLARRWRWRSVSRDATMAAGCESPPVVMDKLGAVSRRLRDTRASLEAAQFEIPSPAYSSQVVEASRDARRRQARLHECDPGRPSLRAPSRNLRPARRCAKPTTTCCEPDAPRAAVPQLPKDPPDHSTDCRKSASATRVH